MKCELCLKSGQYGHNVSHSKRHTAHRWLPNLHAVKVVRDGKPSHAILCTRCMRTIRKYQAV
ncbi:MAG: 50S ribosomal protein L28 [Dehalococcoidales bacterium]|nr:50S ribosomal protein L28 [Dehalococcoidales bacterium]